MHGWPDDVRLFATIAANALLLIGSFRVARRHSPRLAVALPDALLLWLAAQYVITGTLGVLGVLWPGWMLGIGATVGVGMILLARGTPAASLDEEDRVTLAAMIFAAAYVGACCFNQRVVPQLATDVLVYHLPVAANWVQSGRISLVDLWYWLPDNTYSPLGGSVWIAWWLAPIGNDSLARFVQAPMWLLLMASLLRLMRDLRVPIAIAAILALTVVVARPFVSQVLIAKDDLAVAAMAVFLLSSLVAHRLKDRGAAWRLALAAGLLASTKYPAILTLPALAPALLCARWHRVGMMKLLIALLVAAAFVAPWLIRNAILTGNPVFPIGSSDASYAPDPDLRSLSGLSHTLSHSHHALPPVMWILAAAGTLATAWWRRRTLMSDGVTLSLIAGPIASVVLVAAAFPFAEVRFLFTAFALGLATIGIALARLRNRKIGTALAAIVLIASLLMSFAIGRWGELLVFNITGLVAAVISLGFIRLPRGWRRASIGFATLCLIITLYVQWTAYLRHPDVGYARSTDLAWAERYGGIAQLWTLLRTNVPAGATIAYANTPTIWPLFGFDLQYRVVHVPARPGVEHLHDLPRTRDRVPVREAYAAATRRLQTNADEATWLANLDRLRPDYLFIAKRDASPHPPELKFIANHPARFERMTENEEGVVFRLRR